MHHVLSDDGFWFAFVVAAILAVPAIPLARRTPVRLAFATIALVAALVSVSYEYDLGARLGVGVLFVALAGLLEEHGAGAVVWIAVRVCGAVLIVSAPSGSPGWARVLAFVVVVVVVPLTRVAERRAVRLLPVLVAVSVVGVYVCVPDTELPLVLLGAVLPPLVLVLDRAVRPSASTGALVALVVYAVLVGGVGRAGSVVGGLACVVALALPSLAGWFDGSASDRIVLVATHAAVVLWSARVAGLRESAWVALALCLPALVVGAIVLAVTSRRSAARPQ